MLDGPQALPTHGITTTVASATPGLLGSLEETWLQSGYPGLSLSEGTPLSKEGMPGMAGWPIGKTCHLSSGLERRGQQALRDKLREAQASLAAGHLPRNTLPRPGQMQRAWTNPRTATLSTQAQETPALLEQGLLRGLKKADLDQADPLLQSKQALEHLLHAQNGDRKVLPLDKLDLTRSWDLQVIQAAKNPDTSRVHELPQPHQLSQAQELSQARQLPQACEQQAWTAGIHYQDPAKPQSLQPARMLDQALAAEPVPKGQTHPLANQRSLGNELPARPPPKEDVMNLNLIRVTPPRSPTQIQTGAKERTGRFESVLRDALAAQC